MLTSFELFILGPWSKGSCALIAQGWSIVHLRITSPINRREVSRTRHKSTISQVCLLCREVRGNVWKLANSVMDPVRHSAHTGLWTKKTQTGRLNQGRPLLSEVELLTTYKQKNDLICYRYSDQRVSTGRFAHNFLTFAVVECWWRARALAA